jgi:excinuclease UvrABC nuclease subunit
LEALILEANLIKKYQPKYNTKEKDNKSFNYVVITDEDFPRVLISRERNLLQAPNKSQKFSESTDIFLLKNSSCSRQSRSQASQQTSVTYLAVFGPFTNSTQLKEALKIVRKIFPFRDRCVPVSGKPCFNRQIGLCPGVCDNSINKKEYKKILNKIIMFFSGKVNSLKKSLEKEMKALARKHEFEKAGETKRQIFALNHIQDVSLISPFPALDKAGWHSDAGAVEKFRIEAYDVAHLSGTNNVGVMVVMENGPAGQLGGELKKSDYRKFIIRNSKGNDVGALQEILERRLKHKDWPSPDLIVVDGGTAQLNAAVSQIRKHSEISLRLTADLITPRDIRMFPQKVVAVTKDDKHKAKAIIGPEDLVKKYKKEILLINAEAHRFAIAFHRQKRSVIL